MTKGDIVLALAAAPRRKPPSHAAPAPLVRSHRVEHGANVPSPHVQPRERMRLAVQPLALRLTGTVGKTKIFIKNVFIPAVTGEQRL